MTSEFPAPGNTRANSANSGRKQTGLSRLNPFRNLPSLLSEYKKAYLWLNAGFYGAMAVGMLAAAIHPPLHESTIADAREQLSQPGLGASISQAYDTENVLLAIAITFAVNLGASVLLTTLPSFVVPFLGIALVGYRAVYWGFLYTPAEHDMSVLPHYLTLLIEGQANVLVILAVYVHGRRWLWPHSSGLTSRWAGYKSGVRATVTLTVAAAAVFFVGAVYEALEVIYLIPK